MLAKTLEPICRLNGDAISTDKGTVHYVLATIVGSVPLGLIWPFRNVLMDKMSTSISNFPGPVKRIRMPASLTGETGPGVGTLKEVYFTVAPPFSYGPYVTMASYNGKMYLGISIAEKLMSQEQVRSLVRDRIPAAFSKLAQVVKRQ
jgi:hypothetical protein